MRQITCKLHREMKCKIIGCTVSSMTINGLIAINNNYGMECVNWNYSDIANAQSHGKFQMWSAPQYKYSNCFIHMNFIKELLIYVEEITYKMSQKCVWNVELRPKFIQC